MLLVDTMGHLASIYSIARVAIIGGSWEAVGGHNPFEAAVWGIPIIYGPFMEQLGCRMLERSGQAQRLGHAWAELPAALADSLARSRLPAPCCPDSAAATWHAWQRWGIAPADAHLAE